MVHWWIYRGVNVVDVAFRLVVVIGVAVSVWHSALMHGRVMALMVGGVCCASW